MRQILKYPRTLHLRGSTLQQGDDPDQVSMASLKGEGNFVFEEKADGANAGLSFDPDDGDMVLQSRGHSLDGGGRERQFDIFKSWAQTFERTSGRPCPPDTSSTASGWRRSTANSTITCRTCS